MQFKYRYQIKATRSGEFELKFPDLVGARDFFSTEAEAAREAVTVFIEAVQHRFENRTWVPMPSEQTPGDLILTVPPTFGLLISTHNERVNASEEQIRY